MNEVIKFIEYLDQKKEKLGHGDEDLIKKRLLESAQTGQQIHKDASDGMPEDIKKMIAEKIDLVTGTLVEAAIMVELSKRFKGPVFRILMLIIGSQLIQDPSTMIDIFEAISEMTVKNKKEKENLGNKK